VKGRCLVDTVLIPNSFYTIRAGENQRVHVREVVGATTTFRIINIAEGQYSAYSLKDALLTALQTGKSIPGNYTVSYDPVTNKLSIGTLDASASFTIYPTALLKADSNNSWNVPSFAAGGPLVDPKNLMDAGSVTGWATGTVAQTGSLNTPVVAPDVVNCLPYHQLFLRSSLGSDYNAIGPDGSSDIIRRIVCQVPLNAMIVDQHALPYDAVSLASEREINSLSFTLTDCFGKILDTKGHHISFSIIFLTDEE